MSQHHNQRCAPRPFEAKRHYAGNCLICAIGEYRPAAPDNCVMLDLLSRSKHVDIMDAGRRAFGNDTYRPLSSSYAKFLAKARIR